MRYLYLSFQLLFGFFVQKGQAQEFNDLLDVSSSPQQRYALDAEQLATRLAYQQRASEDVSFEHINLIEGLLWAINNHHSYQTDAVTQQFDVHPRATAHAHDFWFYTTDSLQWAREFIHTRNIENTPFANLFAAYPNLSLSFESVNDGFYAFAIHSDIPMNMDFFHQQFSNQTDVMWANLPDNDASGSDVKLEKIKGGWRLIYTLRNVENYPHDYEYSWHFGIDDNKSVHLFHENSNYFNLLPPNYEVKENPSVNMRP